MNKRAKILKMCTHTSNLENNKIFKRDIYTNASNCDVQKNSAITLIALIITIIVLLILAGVTLNMVMGENGIINKAQIAKEKTNKAQEDEKDNLANLESELDKQTTSRTGTVEFGDQVENINFPYTATEDGFITVTVQGNPGYAYFSDKDNLEEESDYYACVQATLGARNTVTFPVIKGKTYIKILSNGNIIRCFFTSLN